LFLSNIKEREAAPAQDVSWNTVDEHTVAPDISGAVRLVRSGTLFFVHTPFYYLLRRLLQQEH